jgi:hypothetical protein
MSDNPKKPRLEKNHLTGFFRRRSGARSGIAET